MLKMKKLAKNAKKSVSRADIVPLFRGKRGLFLQMWLLKFRNSKTAYATGDIVIWTMLRGLPR